MFEPFSFARILLTGGAVLLVFGLILWHVLSIATPLPPYAITAVLALGYGGYEELRGRLRPRQDRA